MMQAIDVTQHSRITQQLVPSTTAPSFICCSQFAYKKKLLMTFGTTLIQFISPDSILPPFYSVHPFGSLMLICNYTAWNDCVLFLPAWSNVTWAREIVYCVRGYSGRLLPAWVMSTFAPCWPTGILLLPGIGVAVAIAVNMSSETLLLLTHALTSVSMIKFVSKFV